MYATKLRGGTNHQIKVSFSFMYILSVSKKLAICPDHALMIRATSKAESGNIGIK